MTNPSMRSPPTTPPRRGRGNGSVSFRYVNESPTNAALLRKTRRRKSTFRVLVGQWFESHGLTRPSVVLTLLTCLIVAFGLFSLAETPRTNITDELSGWERIASKVHPNNWAPGYSDTFRYKSQNYANGPTRGEVALAEAAPYEDVSNPDDEPEALDPVPIHGAGRRPTGAPQRVDMPAKPKTEDKGVPQNVHPIDADEVTSNGIEEASEKDRTTDKAISNQTNRHDGGDRDGDHYDHDQDPDREEQNPDTEDDTDLSEGKNAEDDDQEDVVDEDDPDHLEQELQAVVAAAALAASTGSKSVEVVTLKPKFEDDRKFLFVAWIGEQETKAQLHLYQLGLLAVALNRTLVLPQVHKSRFSTCYTSPFSLYYSIDTLDSFNIPWITHADFLALAHRESQNQKSESSAKTGQLVGMVRGKEVPADAAIIPLNELCLANLGLEFEAYEPKAFFRNCGTAKIDREGIEFAQRMIEDLQARDPNTGTTADVIVIQYNLRHQILTPGIVRPYQAPGSKPVRKYQYFQYSSHWTLLGQQMAQALSPFLAVHWRTETVSVDVLRPCGLSLIAWVKQAVAKRPEVKTVYFAMDYPIELWFDGAGPGSKFSAHSGSMTKTITAEHHAAFRGFVEDWKREFGDTVKMTSFKGVLGSVEFDKDLRALLGVGANQAQADFDRLDEAIVGIVDKNILAKAEVFLAGSPSTAKSTLAKYCAKNSQFTEQVIDGRTTAIKKQGSSSMASSEGQLWNAVDRFARTPSRQRT